jgi:uncharacterized protein (DUF1778 family)
MRKTAMLAPTTLETRARRPKAEDRIDARLPADTKQIIERAAVITGVTLSDFVISRAYEAAAAIVREHDTWVLSRRESKAFVDALLNPPEPNKALRAAASRYKSHV